MMSLIEIPHIHPVSISNATESAQINGQLRLQLYQASLSITQPL